MNSVNLSVSKLTEAEHLYKSGRVWLTVQEAARFLQCDPSSLIETAKERGSLGSVQFYWKGNFLRISTQSVIHFLMGGMPMNELKGKEVSSCAPITAP